jgi:hypothetical protein
MKLLSIFLLCALTLLCADNLIAGGPGAVSGGSGGSVGSDPTFNSVTTTHIASTGSLSITLPTTLDSIISFGFVADPRFSINLWNTQVLMHPNMQLMWGTDTILLRDAANTLALRNGTNAQTLNVYGSYTDPSNYYRAYLSASGVGLEGAGTSANADFTVRSAGSGVLYFKAGSANRWQVNASGHLLAVTDNENDIGASGANRPRNIYSGNDIFSGRYMLSQSGFFVPASSVGQVGLTYGGADGIGVLSNAGINGFMRLCFGGTDASFPAIKRTGSDIEITKADGTTTDTAIILGSPNGTRYRVTVANDGTLTTTAQ